MRYGIAWLLGVPVSVLVIWWLVAHCETDLQDASQEDRKDHDK